MKKQWSTPALLDLSEEQRNVELGNSMEAYMRCRREALKYFKS
ncbi:hypothetical protein MHB50_14305 [Siminovitchia sp. FSL H7-0308]